MALVWIVTEDGREELIHTSRFDALGAPVRPPVADPWPNIWSRFDEAKDDDQSSLRSA